MFKANPPPTFVPIQTMMKTVTAFRFALLFGALTLLTFPAVPALAQNQMELNQAAADAYKKADAELNKVYQETLAALTTPELKEAVRKTQRAWLVYRDLARDEAGLQYEGGSIRPLIEFNALTLMTEQRTQQLKELTEH